jgi:UDP-N-acetylmuramoyl-L-alanyl-D-glutamate--2,6-diaminopimelate ligase
MSGMGVQLGQIAQELSGVSRIVGPDTSILDVTHDSRQVREGSLFVAIRGAQADGHDFVDMAVKRGAAGILVESLQDAEIAQIVVASTRAAMPWAARVVYGSPDDSLTVVGVTGTNGKTTVVHMLESILGAADTPVGLIGTLGARIGTHPIPTARTTPEAPDLQRMLGVMRDSGIRVVLMEVSSHAIKLHRCDAIHFSVVGFTNLSQDHLDFHSDMESYFATKMRLFTSGVADRAVINIGDPWGERLRGETRIPATTVSVNGEADVSASDLHATSKGTSFRVVSDKGAIDFDLPLVGDFNVANALVALSMAQDLGVDMATAAKGLSSVQTIPGRMEVIAHDGPFTVIVDYAHTPDAIAVVLGAVGTLSGERVIALVGAGGDRDKEKRSIMGAAAARLSDVTIITTDNPRTESPLSIAEEIARGAAAQPNTHVEVILDRRSAIGHAISIAEEGDVVVILGKGHEQGQDIGSNVLPFDDRDEARAALVAQGWEPA